MERLAVELTLEFLHFKRPRILELNLEACRYLTGGDGPFTSAVSHWIPDISFPLATA